MTRALNKESLNVALLEAAENGNAETVKTLIDAGADLNTAMNSGTPLYVACQNGHTEIAKLLLQKENIQVNKADKDGATPLYVACQNGHTATVEFLLTKNADINQARDGVFTPLFIACQNGHTEIAKLLLQKENIQVNKADKDGATPLFIACQKGHTETAELLLENRAEVNKARKGGYTPLYIACYNGHTEIAKLLLQKENIQVNKADKDGATPLYVACKKGHKEIAELLLTNGAEVNQARDGGYTPLYIACKKGHTEIVELLLKQANIGINQAETQYGWTPLYTACYNGHTATVELLLKQANIGINQAETQYGWTPLYTACYNGHTATVELLLTKNANINQAINYKYFFAGQTPLYIACQKGHTATVELLLQKENIQVDKANKYGKTPLLIAAQSRHHDIVKILFDNGANPKVFIKPGIFKNSFIPQYENFSDDVKKIIKEICTDKAIEHRDEKLKIQRTIKNQLNVIKEQDKEDLKKSLNDYLDGYNDNWRDNYISLKLFSSHHTDYKLSSLTKEDLDQLFENKTFKSILLLNYADSIKDKFAIIGDKEEIFKIVKAQHDISDDDEKQYQEYKAKVVNTKDIDNIIKYALDVLKINKSVNSEEPQKTFTERYSSNSERRYSIREAQRDAAEMDGLFNEKGCSIS